MTDDVFATYEERAKAKIEQGALMLKRLAVARQFNADLVALGINKDPESRDLAWRWARVATTKRDFPDAVHLRIEFSEDSTVLTWVKYPCWRPVQTGRRMAGVVKSPLGEPLTDVLRRMALDTGHFDHIYNMVDGCPFST